MLGEIFIHLVRGLGMQRPKDASISEFEVTAVMADIRRSPYCRASSRMALEVLRIAGYRLPCRRMATGLGSSRTTSFHTLALISRGRICRSPRGPLAIRAALSSVRWMTIILLVYSQGCDDGEVLRTASSRDELNIIGAAAMVYEIVG